MVGVEMTPAIAGKVQSPTRARTVAAISIGGLVLIILFFRSLYFPHNCVSTQEVAQINSIQNQQLRELWFYGRAMRRPFQ